MTIIPSVSPPLPTKNRWVRSLTTSDPFKWLSQGWRDFTTEPAMSIVYGLIIFVISVAFVGVLVAYVLAPRGTQLPDDSVTAAGVRAATSRRMDEPR